MGGPIYVPPDAGGKPFAGRRGGRKRLGAVVAGVGGLLLLLGGIGLATRGGGEGFDAEPGPLAAALGETDWRFPADPVSGYRRLATPFRGRTAVDRVDLSRDGTLAVGLRLSGGEPWVLVWRGGRFAAHPFGESHGAVTAVGVDPEGVVHVGFSDGALARVSPAGVVAEDGVVADGYSIVGFAFDRASRRSALMLSGGEVRTGLRPLGRHSLHVVPMPPRARIREMIYTADGDLVVAGDAGALFVSTDEGWQERPLPTPGNVTALGLGAGGDLLVAQSNGHVFGGSGVTWDRLGQIAVAPVAVGAVPGRGVVVAASNGRIYATLGRDDFSEVPGYQAPGGFAAEDGRVRGHDVVLGGSDRLLVWDGQLFDSTAMAMPEGTVTAQGCAPVGPPPAAGTDLPTLFDCDEGRHAILGGGALVDVDAVRVAGRELRAVDVVRMLREAERRGAAWVAGEPWAPSPPGQLPAVERFVAEAGRWEPVAPFDLEQGEVLSVSAAPSGETWEVWAATRAGDVHLARVTAGTPPAFEVVATHAELSAPHGETFFPSTVEVHALGSGRALVVHDGWMGTRVGGAVEPLGLSDERPPAHPAFHRVRDGALVVEPGSVRLVGAEETVPWTVPPDADLGLATWARGMFDVAVREGEVLLRAEHAVLSCRDRGCRPVPLPSFAKPGGVTFSPDGRVVVFEPGGMVGIVEPRVDR